VRGNVDISTGDIDFVGNVIVHGDVTDGFEVKADGNVEVRGMVNCSRIQATGNVAILGGFLGKDKGEIVSDGSIGVKFVENGVIRAADAVVVEKAVMHSTLLAGKRIHVRGVKGLIVGGSATAGEEIEATTIGSALGTKTVLSVGVDFASRERSAKIDRELEEVNINLEKIQKTLGFFGRIARRLRGASPGAGTAAHQERFDRISAPCEEGTRAGADRVRRRARGVDDRAGHLPLDHLSRRSR
jgi:hypothetical protein